MFVVYCLTIEIFIQGSRFSDNLDLEQTHKEDKTSSKYAAVCSIIIIIVDKNKQGRVGYHASARQVGGAQGQGQGQGRLLIPKRC